MMYNLKIRQEQINHKIGNFGSVKISMEVLDRKIEQEERRVMKRRVLCKGCFEYKSVSGSCSC